MSTASKAAVSRAPISVAACSSRSGLRPVSTTSAPSARAARAVAKPIPALPPITTTVWSLRSGARCVGDGVSVVVIVPPLVVERLERADVDLREGGEGLDRVAQHVQRDAGADGQRRLLQPFAGLGAERVGAGQALAVAEQGEEAVGFGVRARIRLRLGHLRQQ